MIFHFRYPFWVNSDEAWSIGFSVSQDPFENLDLDKSGVVSYKFIDSVNRQTTQFIADPFVAIEEDMFYIFFEYPFFVIQYSNSKFQIPNSEFQISKG